MEILAIVLIAAFVVLALCMCNGFDGYSNEGYYHYPVRRRWGSRWWHRRPWGGRRSYPYYQYPYYYRPSYY